MKYVMLQNFKTGFLSPVFCVAPMTHRDLALAFASTHQPISAGFCDKGPDDEWVVFGESESLSLKANPSDGRFITGFIRATLAQCQPTAACPV